MKRKAKRAVEKQIGPRQNPHFINGNIDGFGKNVPPHRMAVFIYFEQKELPECVDDFLADQELSQLKTVKGAPIRNWKVCAAEWIFNHRQEMKRKFRRSPFNSQSF